MEGLEMNPKINSFIWWFLAFFVGDGEELLKEGFI
jgi:hypothetical protein